MKTIRFLGGPADHQLRVVDDKTTRIEFAQPAEMGFIPIDEKIEYIYHIYLEAFPNSAYFKYQGTEKRTEEMPRFLCQLVSEHK